MAAPELGFEGLGTGPRFCFASVKEDGLKLYLSGLLSLFP